MALLKEIEIAGSGIAANYWRIINLSVDLVSKVTKIEVACYKDQQARLDGKAPIIRKTFQYSNLLTASSLQSEEVLTICYAKLKECTLINGFETNQFSDAESL